MATPAFEPVGLIVQLNHLDTHIRRSLLIQALIWRLTDSDPVVVAEARHRAAYILAGLERRENDANEN